MRKLTLPLLFLCGVVFAQEKTFTISEATVGQWRQFYPKNATGLAWRGNTSEYTFTDYQNLYLQKAGLKDTTTLFTLEQFNTIAKTGGFDTVRYLPPVTWENAQEFHFFNQNIWYCYNTKENKLSYVIKMPENAQNQHLNFASKRIAYTIDNNVFVKGIDGKEIQITNDANTDIVNGDAVSRSEFGIHDGLFWSPKGSFLAFYRKDNSQVTDYPIVDITERIAECKPIKYPMAGMKSEHISVGVFNFANNETSFIEKDDTVSNKYLANISWDNQEECVYIQVLNREQNHMKMNRYNTKGEFVKTLFEERNDKYVEPQQELKFLKSKNDQFVYLSRRDGYNHAYLYNTNGDLIRQLTKGNFEVMDILGFDSGDKNMYCITTEESPIERHLYRVNLKKDERVKMTTAKGTHSITLHPDAKYYIDNYSNTETPRVVDVYDAKGKKLSNMVTAQNPYEGYAMPEMTIGTLKAADGKTDLFYRLIKPINMEEGKKYPVIVYVYGGPHAQLINNQWLGGARLWEYYMAQKGYVLFTVDSRGSANRGLEFENVIHRQLGVNEMKDQIKGVELLSNMNFVDTARIGVYGWSFGGFMTTSLMTHYPEIFKVGVAGGPVIDWKYYEVMYGERYMDTPEENPEGYTVTSLLPRVKDLKGRLMLIHGAIDPTVVWQHSQLFLCECVKNRVQVDYFVYPRAEHNVGGYDRIHLEQKIATYFDNFLK